MLRRSRSRLALIPRGSPWRAWDTSLDRTRTQATVRDGLLAVSQGDGVSGKWLRSGSYEGRVPGGSQGAGFEPALSGPQSPLLCGSGAPGVPGGDDDSQCSLPSLGPSVSRVLIEMDSTTPEMLLLASSPHSHFIEEETEPQKREVTCSKPVVDLGFQLAS